MPDQLSGLELRIAVCEKAGWRHWDCNNTRQPEMNYRILEYREGKFIRDYFARTKEEAWAKCPPFESSLGALQEAGLIDLLAKVDHWQLEIGHNGTSFFGIVENCGAICEQGETASAALATAICRAYLSME